MPAINFSSISAVPTSKKDPELWPRGWSAFSKEEPAAQEMLRKEFPILAGFSDGMQHFQQSAPGQAFNTVAKSLASVALTLVAREVVLFQKGTKMVLTGYDLCKAGARDYVQNNFSILSGKYLPEFELAARVESQLCDPRLGMLAGKLDKQKLTLLAHNPKAQILYDAESNYINIVQKVDDAHLTITILSDKFKIISVGPIRERNIINSIKNGRYIPVGDQIKDLLQLERNAGVKP